MLTVVLLLHQVFYMDKNDMVCDFFEIVVRYKDNNYHVLKDICVNKDMPVQEKFFLV
ncbi:hypothetical protein Bca4012_038041 [Brassica carinata]